jgi:hypothetical protein
MIEAKKISYDEWVEKYKPVTNHLDKGSAYDGTMFETFGPEIEYVAQLVPTNTVWTLYDVDGALILESGFGYVNRFGYFITEVPHNNEQIWIDTDED